MNKYVVSLSRNHYLSHKDAFDKVIERFNGTIHNYGCDSVDVEFDDYVDCQNFIAEILN